MYFNAYAVPPIIVPFSFGEKSSHFNQYLTLQCTISEGDLPINILWTFNNQLITSELDIITAKMGKRSSVLTIESVTAKHAGIYSCQGENQAGIAAYSTELKVIGVYAKFTDCFILYIIVINLLLYGFFFSY